MQNIKDKSGLNKLEDYTDALLASSASVIDPIVELSFLQGLTNAFKAGSYDEKNQDKVFSILATVVTDYVNQMIPTVIGKANKVFDAKVRDTSTTAKGVKGQLVRGGKQIINKIAPRLLPTKKDTWGKEMTRNDTPTVGLTTKIMGDNPIGRGAGRLLDQISPTTITKTKELDKSERELLRIEKATGEKVLPTQKSVDKSFKINGTDYRYTDEEYNKAKEIFGKESKEALDALTQAKGYDSLASTKEGKEYLAKVSKDIYLYAKQKIKEDYCKKHGIAFEPTANSSKDMYNSITAIEKAGGNAKDYFDFLVNTNGKDTAQKLDYLNKMNVKQSVKDAIYQNDISTYTYVSSGKDEHYDAIQSINNGKVNSDYLTYKQKSKEGYFKGDDKKKRLTEFLKNSNLTNLERCYIYVQEGYVKSLTSTEKQNLKATLERNKSKIDETTYNSMMKKLNK